MNYLAMFCALLLRLAVDLHAADIDVYLSPNGGCTQAVVDAIGAAQKFVLVQAYSFTSKPIAKALSAAKARGLDVRVILDKSQQSERYSSLDFLAHANIPVKIDTDHQIAHNKVMIIDDAVVITGSFNFTTSAETSNAENLLVMRRPDLAVIYHRSWQEHESHSTSYVAR